MTTCPSCGSSDVAEVELHYGADFRPDVEGNVPATGDTIAVCGHCQSFMIAEAEAAGEGQAEKPAAKPRAKPAAKPRAKPAAKA